MNLWSLDGAATQSVIEITAVVIEIVAIVVIIEWLRRRRESRLLRGARQRLFDVVLKDLSELASHIAVLAICHDNKLWVNYRKKTLELADSIASEFDEVLVRHYLNARLISFLEEIRSDVERSIIKVKSSAKLSWAMRWKGAEESLEIIAGSHDALAKLVYPERHVLRGTKIAWRSTAQMAKAIGYEEPEKIAEELG